MQKVFICGYPTEEIAGTQSLNLVSKMHLHLLQASLKWKIYIPILALENFFPQANFFIGGRG